MMVRGTKKVENHCCSASNVRSTQIKIYQLVVTIISFKCWLGCFTKANAK